MKRILVVRNVINVDNVKDGTLKKVKVGQNSTLSIQLHVSMVHIVPQINALMVIITMPIRWDQKLVISPALLTLNAVELGTTPLKHHFVTRNTVIIYVGVTTIGSENIDGYRSFNLPSNETF
jgi:hypothetical protein